MSPLLRHSLLAAVAACVTLIALSSPAEAGTATSNLSVTASVANNCTIATAALAFGAYDPISANASAALNGTGTVTVTCTTGAAATVTLGQGSHAATGSTDALPLRQMSDGAATPHFLAYSMYSDSARSVVWGNTAATGVAETGTGSAVNVTVYGKIAGGANVPAGSYADTVVATVSF